MMVEDPGTEPTFPDYYFDLFSDDRVLMIIHDWNVRYNSDDISTYNDILQDTDIKDFEFKFDACSPENSKWWLSDEKRIMNQL